MNYREILLWGESLFCLTFLCWSDTLCPCINPCLFLSHLLCPLLISSSVCNPAPEFSFGGIEQHTVLKLPRSPPAGHLVTWRNFTGHSGHFNPFPLSRFPFRHEHLKFLSLLPDVDSMVGEKNCPIFSLWGSWHSSPGSAQGAEPSTCCGWDRTRRSGPWAPNWVAHEDPNLRCFSPSVFNYLVILPLGKTGNELLSFREAKSTVK